MNSENNNAESWAPCEPGTLNSYALQAKNKRRQQTMTRVAGITVLMLCVLGLGVWGTARLSSVQEFYYGGIACSEVRENMKAYAMGGLPTELRNRMADHLKECPHCQEMIRQMNTSAFTRPESGCSCAACQQLAQHTLRVEQTHSGRLETEHFSSPLLLVAGVSEIQSPLYRQDYLYRQD